MTRPEGTVYGDHRTVARDRDWPALYQDCEGTFRVESDGAGQPTVMRCDVCGMLAGVVSPGRRPTPLDDDPMLGAT